MRRRTTTIVVLAIASLLFSSTLEAQTPHTWCGKVWTSHLLSQTTKYLVGTSDSSKLHSYQLPRVPPDSIKRVKDEQTCKRAAATYYRDWLGPKPNTGVAVFRVGNVYVVSGERHNGEFSPLLVLNARFERISGFSQ